jgi:hypothetical protein
MTPQEEDRIRGTTEMVPGHVLHRPSASVLVSACPRADAAVPDKGWRILSVVATHTLPAIVPRWLKLACGAFPELRWQGFADVVGFFLAA